MLCSCFGNGEWLSPKGRGNGVKEKETLVVDDPGNTCNRASEADICYVKIDRNLKLNSITSRNSSGGSPGVVKDGMAPGPGTTLFADPKVVEGVDESVNTVLKSFASLVTNEAVTNGLSLMATKLGNPIMLDSYTSSMCLQSWGRMDYARALIDIRVDRELKEDMVIAIPNVEDDGEFLHTVRMEYEWEPPRCGVKLKKLIWQVVSKKNSASSSGTKKNYEVSRKMTSSTNPFDVLNTIEEGDELGSSSSNSSKKVVQDVAGSVSGSPSNTPLVARINDLEINEDNDSEMEEVYDETATYMASTSFNVNKASKSDRGDKSLYEQWKESHGEDPYDDDDFDDPGLTDAQMKFANTFDINLCGQLR
ncbi:hypothetical protein Tco_0642523 [Tanacetum coccineum]